MQLTIYFEKSTLSNINLKAHIKVLFKNKTQFSNNFGKIWFLDSAVREKYDIVSPKKLTGEVIVIIEQ